MSKPRIDYLIKKYPIQKIFDNPMSQASLVLPYLLLEELEQTRLLKQILKELKKMGELK